MLARLAILTLGLSCLAAPALADSVSDGVAAMPASVEDVRIAGAFEKDGTAGVYRVVILRRNAADVTARLFVQWISYGDDGAAKLDNSIEIPELAALKADILDYTSEADSDGLSLFLEMVDPTGGIEPEYELHIFSPTEYRFGPASN